MRLLTTALIPILCVQSCQAQGGSASIEEMMKKLLFAPGVQTMCRRTENNKEFVYVGEYLCND
jgi:hypothetical protein